MLKSLLIANRGEIACRIISTARRLGLHTVAVYSDADIQSSHVRMADTAVRLGPAPARDSYLRADLLINAARATGAEAIHPGYGFLAENAGFAAACREHGIAFVGPSAEAIAAMGSKSAAKEAMRIAGVPVLPGYHGQAQDVTELEAQARRLGVPLIVKPSGGGGGKGMRIVRALPELREALESARRLAQSAFSDPTLLLERYLPEPRHVEVQILADTHGNVLHLFDRDCSVQRRHQKLIEEAPAPSIPAEVRAQLHAAAVTVARTIGYASAGTVEFLYSQGEFWFMEMNTRLQVEHPVTEAITGLDLVEWQLRIASGERLTLAQSEITSRGHAVEVRICAEDPDHDFTPSTGRLMRLHWPRDLPDVRVDAGFETDDVITSHYDSLLGKVIASGATRELAVQRLARALDATRVVGVRCNAEWLARALRAPAFVEGRVTTRFVEEHAGLLRGASTVPDRVLALAAIALADGGLRPADPRASPWEVTDAFRINLPHRYEIRLEVAKAPTTVVLERHGRVWRAEVGGQSSDIAWHTDSDGQTRVEVEGQVHPVEVVIDAQQVHVWAFGNEYVVSRSDPREAALEGHAHAGALVARLPGTVVSVAAIQGAVVAAGDLLMVIEAMKMEHNVFAPVAGTVKVVHFRPGDRVEEGAQLLEIAPDQAPP